MWTRESCADSTTYYSTHALPNGRKLPRRSLAVGAYVHNHAGRRGAARRGRRASPGPVARCRRRSLRSQGGGAQRGLRARARRRRRRRGGLVRAGSAAAAAGACGGSCSRHLHAHARVGGSHAVVVRRVEAARRRHHGGELRRAHVRCAVATAAVGGKSAPRGLAFAAPDPSLPAAPQASPLGSTGSCLTDRIRRRV